MRFRVALSALALAAVCLATSAQAQDPMRACMTPDWLEKSDEAFAADCADLAFEGSLEQRQFLAWMFFVRTNQLIADQGGVSDTGRVPLWMAWPTDDDTFVCNPSFKFKRTNRDDIVPVTEKKVLAGRVATDEPDSANEEVTRNKAGYDYIKSAGLNTKQGVIEYINAGNAVDMPVGSVEIKASWLRVPDGGSAPEGALSFRFASGTYWWRGLHIMVKMRPAPKNLFYNEEPSWFWTTFEFNDNPGAQHVRDTLITQRAPLSAVDIEGLLALGGIAGAGFENYAPNGTQIRYTVDGKGTEPIILGHTDMEDFAGSPNTAQPEYWRSFDASCHACHATASINPKTEEFFPFTVPTGALTPQYYGTVGNANVYLGDGFVPLDFMWPISFHAVKGRCK
jgi:hypothetical protein